MKPKTVKKASNWPDSCILGQETQEKQAPNIQKRVFEGSSKTKYTPSKPDTWRKSQHFRQKASKKIKTS